ncbi:hypothetical protein PISL3812_05958 [Talaromyces islandicus]|uniref:Uncharacterized protein n=1 Tax=Talaromyces islandicus TaxID=28573 RepID=A0A0U1M043_TALIS|nr:hypothetical protein PISL3812_05958 [Talaromyces islandicus]
MAPDLNSLPPSRSSTSSPLHTRNLPSAMEAQGHSNNNGVSQTVPSQSPSVVPIGASDLSHRSSLSGHRGSPRSSRPSISESRRRSGIGMHFNLNDPPGAEHREHRSSSIGNYFRNASPSSLGGSPIIGTGDPHHQRAPSLGELHQELEQEQEAQVNRLLHMIRQQQSQLQQLHQQQQQQQQGQTTNSGAAVIDDITPGSERSQSFPAMPPLPAPGSRSMQTPLSHSTRRSSRRSSRASESASPNLNAPLSQPTSAIDLPHGSFSSDWSVVGGNESAVPATRRSSRDESAFYQAEAAMLTRENQMLRMRIRELERQLTGLSSASNNLNETGGSGGNTSAAGDASASTEAEEKT